MVTPSFIEDYNRQLASCSAIATVRRTVREDEDLDLHFSWNKAGRVRSNLTLQQERKIHLLADSSENRRLIGEYIGGRAIPPYSAMTVGVVEPGAVVNQKRPRHGLQAAQIFQAQRDDRGANTQSTAPRSRYPAGASDIYLLRGARRQSAILRAIFLGVTPSPQLSNDNQVR